MIGKRRRLAAVCGAALVQAACAAPIHKLKIAECPVVTTKAGDFVDVRYLGVGGVLLSRGSDVILTAPLYSNPSLVEFAADHQIRSDPTLIERLFPLAGRAARAILVGHSHYDHLMDVPYVALNLATSADVYGSQTTVNLLHEISGKLAPRQVIALDQDAFDPWSGKPGRWQPITKTLRVMAIRSEHSDQFELKMLGLKMAFHTARGLQDKPLAELPKRASEWAEGGVFAYLIDFLDERGVPVFRVYYQDSGTNWNIGLPSATLLDGKNVDLALICVGGEFKRLRGHPEHLIRVLKPRFALLIHWEDFFVTQQAACVDKAFRSTPTMPGLYGHIDTTDVERFRTRIKETDKSLFARTWLPCPTASTFRLPLGNEAVQASRTTFDCDQFYSLPVAR